MLPPCASPLLCFVSASLWPRPRNRAMAGRRRTRFRCALRVSSPTIARPRALNARPSGLPSRSPSCHASRSEAVPPPAGSSASRAIVEDLSLRRERQPSGPISRSLKSAQVLASVLSGSQIARATNRWWPLLIGHGSPPASAPPRTRPRDCEYGGRTQ